MSRLYFMPVKDILYNENHRFIADRMMDTRNSMSFLNEQYKDIAEWKANVQRYLSDRLLITPVDYEYTERIVEEEDFGSYVRQKLYIRYNSEYELPAYLLLPKNCIKPCPAAVVLHDHGEMFYWGKEKSVEHKNPHPMLKQYQQDLYEGQSVASEMARRGYVTLVIDALLFGERRYMLEKNPDFALRLEMYKPDSNEYISAYNNMEFEVEWEFVRMMQTAGLDSMGLRIADDMASVGYLAQRSEVDAERICCIGLSMGGLRSGWLSAMDNRVRCSVLVGWMALLSDMMKNRPANYTPIWGVSGLYGRLDYPDMVSMAAPKPLMLMHGLKDGLFTHTEEDGTINKSGEKGMEIVRKVYEKAGCPENLSINFYDRPHEFNKAMQEDAYTWLAKKLVL